MTFSRACIKKSITGPNGSSARCRPFPGGKAREVFTIPELLDLILAHLDADDLRRLKLVNSFFYPLAQAAYLRTAVRVSVTSFDQLRRLSSIWVRYPHLIHSVSEAKLSLMDPLATVWELDDVQRYVAALEADELDQRKFEYRPESEQTGGFMWRDELEKALRGSYTDWDNSIGGDSSGGKASGAPSSKEVSRREEVRRKQVLHLTVGVLDAAPLKGLEVASRKKCASWPLVPLGDTDPVFRFGLGRLLASVVTLILDFPLSHTTSNIASFLQSSQSLRDVTIRSTYGASPNFLAYELSRGHLEPPSSCGTMGKVLHSFLRASSASPSVVLSSSPRAMIRCVQKIRPHPGPPKNLQILSGGDANVPGRCHWPVIPRPPSLSLDFQAFCGTSTRLTSLVLEGVVSIATPTIYAAICAAGPSLLHLRLRDINIDAASTIEPLRLDMTSWYFVDGPNDNDPDLLGNLSAEQALKLERSEASQTLNPSLDDRREWPTVTLSDALRACTSLRTLVLSQDRRLLDSPYLPALLDALIEANPPLELLRWRVSVDTPARLGRPGMSAREWQAFAIKAQRFVQQMRSESDKRENAVFAQIKADDL
ncbi:hypothetical protein JCM11641_006844 [Rhodosporidiobolus odoratus]